MTFEQWWTDWIASNAMRETGILMAKIAAKDAWDTVSMPKPKWRRHDWKQLPENLESEEWRAIPDFPGYVCSSEGRFARLIGTKRRIMVGAITNLGYICVKFRKDGKQYSQNAHRMIAAIFLPAPLESQKVVNHKDGNKRNNRAENLEWLTQKENSRHYHDVLKPKRSPIAK